jgi:hypothetical protein
VGFDHQMVWDTYTFLGFQNRRVYYNSNLEPYGLSSYHIYDYSVNPLLPLNFQIQTTALLSGSSSACFIDSFISFNYSVSNNSLALDLFDVRSNQSKPLSSFIDQNFQGGKINNIVVDSATNEVFFIAAKSFAIYEYSRGPAAIKMNPKSLQRKSSGAITAQVMPKGVLIKFDIQKDLIEGLFIYTVEGKIVRHFPASLCRASEGLLWDAKDDRGATLSLGPYFLVLKVKKSSKIGKVFLIQRY